VVGGCPEQRAEFAAGGQMQPGRAAGQVQTAAVVSPEQQFVWRVDESGDTADHGLGGGPASAESAAAPSGGAACPLAPPRVVGEQPQRGVGAPGSYGPGAVI